MPCSAEVVGGDVGEDRDVVVGDADALEQDPAAGRLGHGELHLGVREHPAGPAGTRVVAGLDQHAVDVDAVGARPAHVQAVGAGDVRHHPGGRGLAVGAGHRDDRDPRPQGRRSRRRARPHRTRAGRVADSVSRSGSGSASSTSATARPSASRPVPAAPRVGDHDLVHVVGRPHPDGQPRRAGLARDVPDQPADRTGGEALPEAAARAPRAGPAAGRSGRRTAAPGPRARRSRR